MQPKPARREWGAALFRSKQPSARVVNPSRRHTCPAAGLWEPSQGRRGGLPSCEGVIVFKVEQCMYCWGVYGGVCRMGLHIFITGWYGTSTKRNRRSPEQAARGERWRLTMAGREKPTFTRLTASAAMGCRDGFVSAFQGTHTETQICKSRVRRQGWLSGNKVMQRPSNRASGMPMVCTAGAMDTRIRHCGGRWTCMVGGHERRLAVSNTETGAKCNTEDAHIRPGACGGSRFPPRNLVQLRCFT